MTRMFLIRHGLTEWNRERRFQGQTDIPLADEGLEQAQKLGRHFRGQSLAAVYASDLSRAWRTAEPIAAATGAALIAERGLRERAFGLFEGLTHEVIVAEHGEAYARWRARELDFAIGGGGESLRQLHARVLDAMSRLASRHAGQTIALVTHGGVLDCAYRIAGGLPLTDPTRPELPNAAINLVRHHPGAEQAYSIEIWGDVGHLD